nr:histone deacetylase 14 [Tanacetum cinerariifolium]
MADVNAPSSQAPAMVPPVRTDDQILPRIRWVPIGKSNCYLDLEKSQSNPIYKIVVDLLKHTNFLRAFTASSTIPSIYIQQHLEGSSSDHTGQQQSTFIPPPTADALINIVNELGYPKLVRNLSNVITNDMFQPWRALITIINLCLTGKTYGFERPRAPVLQILWGIVIRANIDYAERIWEEFTQSRRHKFHPRPDSVLYLPNEEPVLGYLKFSAKGTKKEVFGIPILGSLITADIQEASYYQEYLENVAKHRRYMAGETGSDQDSPASKPTKPARKPKLTAPKAPSRPSVSNPVTSAQHAPTSAPAKPQEKKRKQATKTSEKHPKAKKSKYGFIGKKRSLKSVVAPVAEDVPAMEPHVAAKDADLQKALEESMKTMYAPPRGPLPLVVIKESESIKYQPLPEVPGKGNEKVTEEQVSHELLSLQKPKKKSPSKSEETEKVMHVANEGGQGESEGQAEPDPGQARPDLGNTGADVQSIPSPVVHAGSDQADMKEILNQRMWETRSYKSHKDHLQLFEALEKSMNRDHSEELAQDLPEARKKKKKSHESPKTPHGSPPHQPPPPPPPTGPFGASGAPRASGSSQVPPPSPPPSSTNQEKMDEDMAPDEQAQSSDDEDIESAHIPKVLALASNYSPPPKDSLLAQTNDIATFMDWFCKRRGINEFKPQDLEGPAFEIVKFFHPGVIHLQYQMEECHKLLTDHVDDLILRHNVSKPLPLGGSPGQVTIQSDFFFNKDLEYLRYGSKGSRPALSISKMKAAYYPDAGLEQMVPDQFWIDEECKYAIAVMTHMRILSVIRIKVFSMYGYDYMKKIVLRHADLNEHVIVERDFKYMYPSDFEDLYMLNLQGHLNHLSLKDKKILTTAVNQWTRHLVIRQCVEDFQLGIESYQTQLNLTKPQWDAMGFKYKHDYTVIDSPRAVMFRDKYGVLMMMASTRYTSSVMARCSKSTRHWITGLRSTESTG